MSNPPNINRLDHRMIFDWIEPNSKVLDLGCGDGELLSHLIQHKAVKGTGIEINEKAIYKCIERGLTVSHGDIDSALSDYSTKRFDYVILNESLQQVLHPEKVIIEALRVGKKIIVGIPNFCHWRARVQIFFRGKVPVTKELPFQWYDTPNLRFLSLKDFRNFCREKGITIVEQKAIAVNQAILFRPNVFARIGLFLLQKR